jgi:hypothetical protein
MDGGNLENSAATQPDASVPTPETAVRAGASAPQPAVPEKSKSEQALELAEALRKIPEVIIPPLSAGAMNVSPASAFAVFSQVSATSGFALESSPITVAFNAPTFVSNVEIDGTDTIPAKVSVDFHHLCKVEIRGTWKNSLAGREGFELVEYRRTEVV